MRILYLDCGMGAAGDMLTSALLELTDDKEAVIDELNNLGIPGVSYSCEVADKCGIKGTHTTVLVEGEEEHEHSHEHEHEHEHCHEHEHEHSHEHSHEHEHEHEHCHEHEHEHEHCHEHEHEHTHTHHHSSMHDIERIVDALKVSEKVRKDIIDVYRLIANAESSVHGVPVTDIHFHEVGTMDAIADVTAVCLLIDRLKADKIIVSPVHVGCGQVRCAHGILPVPAPATALILKDIPIYGGKIEGELCTPTGAALLKHFANEFGSMPVISTKAIGYGMGKKDFVAANCVRAILGESDNTTDTIVELKCNIDDMTAEAIGFATERIWEDGALDVCVLSAQMKKSRPGSILLVMCHESDKEKMAEVIFKYTGTIGIRENLCKRYVLSRKIETVSTDLGEVRKKVSTGYGVRKEKYEYDDIARIAGEKNMSLDEVLVHLP